MAPYYLLEDTYNGGTGTKRKKKKQPNTKSKKISGETQFKFATFSQPVSFRSTLR